MKCIKDFIAKIDKEVFKNFFIGLDIALLLIISIAFWGYILDDTAEIPDTIAFFFVFFSPLLIALIPLTNVFFKKKFQTQTSSNKSSVSENRKIESLENKAESVSKKSTQIKKAVPKSKTEYYVNSEWFIAKCNRYDEQQAYKEIENEKKEQERLKNYPPLKIIEYAPPHKQEGNSDIPAITVDDVLLKVDNMNADGLKFEKFCAELLLRNGFVKSQVTTGSNDYGVDIIAESELGITFAIQCKCYSNKLDNTPIQEVFGGRQKYNCQVCAVITNSYFTNNAIELARVDSVLLWDRDKLKKFIKNAMEDISDICNNI